MTTQSHGRGAPAPNPSTFTMVDDQLIASKTWQQLSGNAVKLFITLRSYSNGKYKSVWPSIDRLVEHAGISRNTITRCLSELVNLGLIKIEERERQMKTFHFNFEYDKSPIFKKQAKLELIKTNPSNSDMQLSNLESSDQDSRGTCQNSRKNNKQESETRIHKQQHVAPVNTLLLGKLATKADIPIDKIKSWIKDKPIGEEQLKGILEALSSNRKIKNPAGFVRKAITEDWDLQPTKPKQRPRPKKQPRQKMTPSKIDPHREQVFEQVKSSDPDQLVAFYSEIQNALTQDDLALGESAKQRIVDYRVYHKACESLGVQPIK